MVSVGILSSRCASLSLGRVAGGLHSCFAAALGLKYFGWHLWFSDVNLRSETRVTCGENPKSVDSSSNCTVITVNKCLALRCRQNDRKQRRDTTKNTGISQKEGTYGFSSGSLSTSLLCVTGGAAGASPSSSLVTVTPSLNRRLPG